MNKSRILPLLGPAVVLYLIADIASAGEPLTLSALLVSVAAVASSLAPLFLRSHADEPGVRRVGLLGLAAGVAVVSFVRPGTMSIAVEASGAVAFSAVAGLAIDLALTVPDAPRWLGRPMLRSLTVVSSILVGVAGLLGVLPPFEISGSVVFAPPSWSTAPLAFTLLSLPLATILRLFRRRLGSSPEALASSAWALLGLFPTCIAAGVMLAITRFGVAGTEGLWVQALGTAAVVALVVGHIAMVDSRRRLSAGPSTRKILSAVIALGAVSAGVALVRDHIPADPFTAALWSAATLLVAAGLYRAVSPLSLLLLAPGAGRLLSAVGDAQARLEGVASLEDVARAVLGPLRRASGTTDGETYLYCIDPPSVARVDAAGEPHVHKRPVPEAIAAHLLECPGEVLVRGPLETLVVRRPTLRPLIETLVSLDAHCVVPLVFEAEVVGGLLLPRGRRRSTLNLEEINALERLGARVASLVAIFASQARAQRRAAEADGVRKDLEERIDELEDELHRLRAEALVKGAGRASERMTDAPIAYSPQMRAVVDRARTLGPMDAPVLIVAEPGSAIDRVAHQIHASGGRASGALVFADCASVRRERSGAALFGEERESPRPGWLRSAAGGTLLLMDVPALPLDVQHELAEVLAARQARAIDGTGFYPVDVRVIATSRVDIEPLVQTGLFDGELARWLLPLQLRVPPLSERREDLPSLVLLAIDQACRVRAREVVGIDEAALEVLFAHKWPGNLRELQSVVERAVLECTGPKIMREHLPALASLASGLTEDADPLDGTYADIERRMLERALKRASGNKSEAARALGLKRTTFLDKLRRLGLGDGSGKESNESAA